MLSASDLQKNLADLTADDLARVDHRLSKVGMQLKRSERRGNHYVGYKDGGLKLIRSRHVTVADVIDLAEKVTGKKLR